MKVYQSDVYVVKNNALNEELLSAFDRIYDTNATTKEIYEIHNAIREHLQLQGQSISLSKVDGEDRIVITCYDTPPDGNVRTCSKDITEDGVAVYVEI